jgi:hypothetical protein
MSKSKSKEIQKEEVFEPASVDKFADLFLDKLRLTVNPFAKLNVCLTVSGAVSVCYKKSKGT